MRERLERILGRTARAIWILTFHAACGRILRREAERLGYRSSFTIYDQADQVRVVKACLEELGKDPKRFTPRGIHSQISNAKNQLVSPDEYTSRVASFWDQTVAEVYELYQRKLHRLERRRLRRHADAHRRRARALPGGARALAGRLPPRPRRRVPGHEQRPVPPPAAARGEAPERVRGGRSGPVDLRLPRRRHPQHPRLRGGLRRGRTRSRSSRTTARRTRSSRRRTRSSTTTATASRSGSGRSSARATRSRSSRSRTSTPRRASSRPRSRASSSPGSRPPRSPSSTGRTRSRACSRTSSCARGSRTR